MHYKTGDRLLWQSYLKIMDIPILTPFFAGKIIEMA